MDIDKTRPNHFAGEIEEQLQTVVSFLSAVHPSLNKEEGYRPGIELRPIPRGEKTYLSMKSLILWDLKEKSVARLREFLVRHHNQPNCLYYSVFTFDNNKKTFTKKGTAAKQGKINSQTAVFAEEIVLDFDAIGSREYIDLVDRFESLGIYALWVSTGHGYHAHILLEKETEDKDLLRRFVYKFRSKGFYCDTACVDPARVMRLPGTFNYKEFKSKSCSAELKTLPHCDIVQFTEQRYLAETVLEKLDTLETVCHEDEVYFKELNLYEPESLKRQCDKSGKKETTTDMVSVRQIEYPYLSQYELPPAISNMLGHTPKGYRNKVLGFLVNFLKNNYKPGKTVVYETLLIWSKEACVPAYDSKEFHSDFTRFYYHYNGLGYDSSLAQRFGVIDFQTLFQLRKKEIYLPHKFFRDFENLGSADVRAYLALKMLEHLEIQTSQDNMADVLGISTRKLRPTVQNLQKRGHCYLEKGNSRKKIPNVYHTNRIHTPNEGFVRFGYNDLNTYVKELCEQGSRTRSNAELKLYLFMRWKFYYGDIYMSQTNLGKHLGVAQSTISDTVYRLQDKRFIKVNKIRISPLQEACEYVLLR